MNTRIAVAQIDARVGDIAYNIKRHIDCAEEARSKNAHIIIFPELSLTGYSLRDLTHDVTQLSYPHYQEYQNLLKISNEIQIIAGGVEETPRFGLHNSVFSIVGGTLETVHRKIYLPTYGMFEESRYFLPGTTMNAFDTSAGRVGVLVCEDLWHLSLPYILAQDGAEILAGMSASPIRLGGDTGGEPAVAGINLEHHKTYARLLSCYVCFSNRVGFEDGIGFWGGSTIVAPDGTILEQAPFFEEAIIYGDISREEIKRARRDSRHALDERPDFVLKEMKRLVKSK